MEWRNRRTFWAITSVVLALVSIPSVDWVTAVREYWALAGGWQPAPLKPTRTNRLPHEPSRPGLDAARLRPVEFRLKARGAKSVELVGDFNAWQPGLLKMTRTEGDVWTISVPVAAGRHKYLFLVDGDPQVDPGVPTADGPEGRRVSVRVVK